MRKMLSVIGLALLLASCGDTEGKKVEETSKVEVKPETNQKKKLTLEEQSKKFIDENLEGKLITDFTRALINLDDVKLESMIVYGHKNGQQFVDDFDLLGRKATATGKIIDFVELSHNTYNDRGKKSGSVTFTRDDKFYIYMGDKDIENYPFIKYDELLHKDRDKNEFFLGVYPNEVTNFAMVDLDEVATLGIGDLITVEGIVDNYVMNRDYNDRTIIKDFVLSIDNAHVKINNQ